MFANIVIAGFALIASLTSAVAQQAVPERKPCVVIRVQPDAVLERCNDTLRSLSIVMRDIRRQGSVDSTGRVNFTCPVEAMCEGDPLISAWLVDPRTWTRSARDEDAIFALVQTPPVVTARPRTGPEQPRPNSTCPIFDVQVAAIPGRGVCYESGDPKSSGLVIVAADADIGFLLFFRHGNMNSQALREKVLTMVPHFQIDVATGDGELFRWMR